jgi:hypothetical protein
MRSKATPFRATLRQGYSYLTPKLKKKKKSFKNQSDDWTKKGQCIFEQRCIFIKTVSK